MSRPGVGVGVGWGAQVGVVANGPSAQFSGLINGLAKQGDHASITAAMSDASTVTAQAWGNTLGGTQYGSGPNPTDFSALAQGGLLYVRLTSGGEDYDRAVASYAAPSVASAIAYQSFTQGDEDFTLDLDTVFDNATSYSVSGDAAASIDGDGTTLRIDKTSDVSATNITVTATNQLGAGEAVTDVFSLTIAAPAPVAGSSISSVTIEPQNGQSLPINVQVASNTLISFLIFPNSASDPTIAQFELNTDGDNSPAIQVGSFTATTSGSISPIELSSLMYGIYNFAFRASGTSEIVIVRSVAIDNIGPTVSGASTVSSTIIFVEFDEALFGASSADDWTVTTSGAPLSVSAVDISDTVVALTVEPEIGTSDVLFVSFSSASSSLRDQFLNPAISFEDMQVPNIYGLFTADFVEAQGTNTPDQTDGHTFTFDLSAHGPGDIYVVTGYVRQNPNDTSTATVHVNGVQAQLHGERLYTDNITYLGAFYVPDPETDSITVAVQTGTVVLNGGRITCAVIVVNGDGLGGSPTYGPTQSDVSSDVTMDLSLPVVAGDIIIGASYENSPVSTTGVLWTGLDRAGFAPSGVGEGEVLSVAIGKASETGVRVITTTSQAPDPSRGIGLVSRLSVGT